MVALAECFKLSMCRVPGLNGYCQSRTGPASRCLYSAMVVSAQEVNIQRAGFQIAVYGNVHTGRSARTPLRERAVAASRTKETGDATCIGTGRGIGIYSKGKAIGLPIHRTQYREMILLAADCRWLSPTTYYGGHRHLACYCTSKGQVYFRTIYAAGSQTAARCRTRTDSNT